MSRKRIRIALACCCAVVLAACDSTTRGDSPSPTVPRTAIEYVSAVDGSGLVDASRRITAPPSGASHDCAPGSVAVSTYTKGSQVFRCRIDAEEFDACWLTVDGRAACLRSHDARDVVVFKTRVLANDISHAPGGPTELPFGIVLTDGVICRPRVDFGPAHPPNYSGWFACSDGRDILATGVGSSIVLDTSQPMWTAKAAKGTGQVSTVQIKTAIFAR